MLPPKLISFTDFWSIRDTGLLGLDVSCGMGSADLTGGVLVPGLEGSRMVAPLRHSLTLLWLGWGSPPALLVRQAAETTDIGMCGSSEPRRRSNWLVVSPPADATSFFPVLSIAAWRASLILGVTDTSRSGSPTEDARAVTPFPRWPLDFAQCSPSWVGPASPAMPPRLRLSNLRLAEAVL